MQGTEFTYISIWEITRKILRSVTGWMKNITTGHENRQNTLDRYSGYLYWALQRRKMQQTKLRTFTVLQSPESNDYFWKSSDRWKNYLSSVQWTEWMNVLIAVYRKYIILVNRRWSFPRRWRKWEVIPLPSSPGSSRTTIKSTFF